MITAALLLALWAQPAEAQEAPAAPAAAAPTKRRRRPRRPVQSVPPPAPAPPAEAAAAPAPPPPPVDCGPQGELCESPSGDQAVAVPAPEAPAETEDAARRQQQAEFDRLFGPKPVTDLQQTLDPQSLPSFSWWMAPLFLGAGVGLFLLRGRLSKMVTEKMPMQVISRVPLGPAASAVILEVKDGDGSTRRLLLGLNASAAPTLLADLSATPALPEGPPSTSVFVDEPVSLDSPSPAPRTPVEPIRGGWERALRESESTADPLSSPRSGPSPRLRRLPAGLEERDDLIAEVLAERGDGDFGARRKGGPPSRGGAA